MNQEKEREALRKRLFPLARREWAAIAARCARRVEPLTWDLEAKHRSAVSRAIETAEMFARGERAPDTAAAACGADAAAAAVDAYARAAAAYAAADAAYATVDTVADALAAAAAGPAAAASAESSVENRTPAETDRPGKVMLAVYADLEKLEALRPDKPQELGDPIEPSESGPLGPLWPDGAPWWFTNPPGLDNDDERSDHPPLVIVWDPEIVSAEQYAKLVSAIGELVRSEGGLGIERIRSRGYGVPSEAGVVS